MSERYILVGWFNPYNEYHGFQQVHPDHEGEEGTFPLYVRERDFRLHGLPYVVTGDLRAEGK